jgi:hypothetical protein
MRVNTAQNSRRHAFSASPLWGPEISHLTKCLHFPAFFFVAVNFASRLTILFCSHCCEEYSDRGAKCTFPYRVPCFSLANGPYRLNQCHFQHDRPCRSVFYFLPSSRHPLISDHFQYSLSILILVFLLFVFRLIPRAVAA